jgi:hypothetical protein
MLRMQITRPEPVPRLGTHMICAALQCLSLTSTTSASFARALAPASRSSLPRAATMTGQDAARLASTGQPQQEMSAPQAPVEKYTSALQTLYTTKDTGEQDKIVDEMYSQARFSRVSCLLCGDNDASAFLRRQTLGERPDVARARGCYGPLSM